jgi:hypothetical protein
VPWEIYADAASAAALAASTTKTGGAQNDAYKHCLASCLTTTEYGVAGTPIAFILGWGNEVWGDVKGQLSGNRQMDEHNNAIGRGLGSVINRSRRGALRQWLPRRA